MMIDQMYVKLRTLKVVWGAFLIPPLLFFGVVYSGIQGQEGGDATLALYITGAALMELPGLLLIRRSMLGSMRLRPPQDLRVQDRTAPEQLEIPLNQAIRRYHSTCFVSFACAMSMVLFGLVASFVSLELRWFLGLVALYYPLMLLLRPSLEGLMCGLQPEERQGLRALL